MYGNIFGAYRSENLVKYLLDSGYRISIISPEFFYERGEKKDIVAKVLRIVFSGYYLIELFIKAALADVIYLLPLNSELIRPVVWAKRLFKTKLVVEMYISAYDTLVREKQEIPDNSSAARLLYKTERLALTEADYIVHLSRYELSYWEKIFKLNLSEEKILIAPLFCEPGLARFQHQRISTQCLHICWWGTLIPSHGISNILGALHQLKNRDVDFTCQLFGVPAKGKEHLVKTYETQIAQLGLDEMVTLRQDLKFVDFSLPRYLSNQCDLALGIFGDTKKAKAAVPNKLIEALTLGIPSLTMSTPALEEFFDPAVDFWICDAAPETIADMLSQIYNNSAYSVNWSKTRGKVLEIFSLENYHQSIKRVLNRVKTDLSGE